MAKVEKPHNCLEAPTSSDNYLRREEDSGALDQIELLSSMKPCKGETNPRWLRSISRKTLPEHPAHDTTVMAVRKLQEHRRLLHCFSPYDSQER